MLIITSMIILRQIGSLAGEPQHEVTNYFICNLNVSNKLAFTFDYREVDQVLVVTWEVKINFVRYY